MRADLLGQKRTMRQRSNSTNSLAGRLGTRRQSGGMPAGIAGQPRRRINRSNLTTRRPASRQSRPLSRSNSQNRRSNSQNRRSNSRQRFPSTRRDGSVLPQRRTRSVSRNRANTSNLQARRPVGNRSNSRVRGKPRNNSVNARLGINRTSVIGQRRGANGAGGPGVIRGRVFKRRASNAGAGTPKAVAGAPRQRLGRSRTRFVFFFLSFNTFFCVL